MAGFDLSTLNPPQREAVMATEGPCLLLAGAGTGKTRVITYRIAWMLRNGIAPSSIVALSFTNKAAREMKERVHALTGPQAQELNLGTFHSYCLGIIRKFPRESGLAGGFTIIDTSDQIDMVRRALEERGWAGLYRADSLHQCISKAKNHLLLPEEIEASAGSIAWNEDPAVVAAVMNLYERQMLLNRAIDFDDCIYRTVHLLRNHPDVRSQMRQAHRYFLVDEFQDTNASQLAVLELLASDRHDVCVVGDDDQSIYSWRGAMYEILERFQEVFPGARTIKLEQNYRCPNIVLDAANALIKNNLKRQDKSLWSESTETSPIMVLNHADEQKEGAWIAEKCIGLLGGGARHKDICILYRANMQSRPIELALRESGLRYKIYGGSGFFENREVKDFACYLRTVLNPDDRLAFFRIINVPGRGIGMKTLEKLEERATAAGCSPMRLLERENFSTGQSKTDAALREFTRMIGEVRSMPMKSAADLRQLCEKILRLSGLESDVRSRSENPDVRERKLANLRSMPLWLENVATEVMTRTGRITAREILDSLMLDSDAREEKNTNEDHISMMTIHAAKGLEFPHVIVAGVEEGLLPHKNSIETPDGVCEERRLFYVALTRAKTRCYLSWCQTRSSGQGKTDRDQSRFVREIPDACLTASASSGSADRQKTIEARKSSTLSRLGALRESLTKS